MSGFRAQNKQLEKAVDKTDMMINTASKVHRQKCHDIRSLHSEVSTNHMIITIIVQSSTQLIYNQQKRMKHFNTKLSRARGKHGMPPKL